jgi:hypothetical protein
MTLCNMSVEGGARVGYLNPDETTFTYLKGCPYAPSGASWEAAVAFWKSIVSDADARYDDVARFDATEIAPTVTWGINPGQAISIKERLPAPEDAGSAADRSLVAEALGYMQLAAGEPNEGTPIGVAFIGAAPTAVSPTFARWPFLRGSKSGGSARWRSGSMESRAPPIGRADRVFRDAGWNGGSRAAPCASPSTRTSSSEASSVRRLRTATKGRQGSPTGRTILMSRHGRGGRGAAPWPTRDVFAIGEPMTLPKIERWLGPRCVPGEDIDTDRIIPARFLKCVTFDGRRTAFYDARFAPDGAPAGRSALCCAKVLIGDRNFGCGSSREHAPQAIAKRGFQALIAKALPKSSVTQRRLV